MRKNMENQKIKKKGLMTALLVAVAAIPMIYIGMDNFKIEFLPDWSGWQKILDGKDYWLLDIRESDNTLFLAEGFWGDNTIAIYSPDSGEVSTVQAPGKYISRLEVSDVLWVGSYGPLDLLGYDLITETWLSHPETEAFGEHFGWKFTKDGNLLVYGDDFLKEYVDGKWSANYWTLDERLDSVFQDDEGYYYAQTAYTKIYAFAQDQHWEYIGRLWISPSSIRIIDGIFWLLRGEKVRIWDPATPEKMPKLVREFPDEYVKRLIEIQSDAYYTVTTFNFWRFQNREWEKVKIPNLVKRIRNAVFDEALQRMYIATDRGVYYKDLPL